MRPGPRYQVNTCVLLTPQQREFLETISVREQMGIGEILRACVDGLMTKEGAI